MSNIINNNFKLNNTIYYYFNVNELLTTRLVCKSWEQICRSQITCVEPFEENLIKFNYKLYNKFSYFEIYTHSLPAAIAAWGPFKSAVQQENFSPSENYLNRCPDNPQTRYQIQYYQSELRSDQLISSIFRRIFSIEKTWQETHIPCYHSMNTTVFLFSHATKVFLSLLNQTNKESDLYSLFSTIHWFRFPQNADSDFPTRVSDLLKDYPLPQAVKDGGLYDDHHPLLKLWLIAVSPFLFSNCGTPGEGTLDLFLTNRSLNPPDERAFFNAFCDYFGLLSNDVKRHDFAILFEELVGKCAYKLEHFLKRQRSFAQREIPFGDRGNRNFGMLLQIEVPRSIANNVIYPCREYGIPAEFRDKTILEVHQSICQEPHSTASYVAQGRMLTTALLNPLNDIHIFKHGYYELFNSLGGQMIEARFINFFQQVLRESIQEKMQKDAKLHPIESF